MRTGTSLIPTRSRVSLAKFINLADDYSAQDCAPMPAHAASGISPGRTPSDPDPLITSPLYGRWQSLTQRLLFNRDGTAAPNPTNWVHRLNLDPRFRVPANYGAEVVEANAEEYMNYAWEQIGDVLAGQPDHSPSALCHGRLTAAVCSPPSHGRLQPCACAVVDGARFESRPVWGSDRCQPARIGHGADPGSSGR